MDSKMCYIKARVRNCKKQRMPRNNTLVAVLQKHIYRLQQVTIITSFVMLETWKNMERHGTTGNMNT